QVDQQELKPLVRTPARAAHQLGRADLDRLDLPSRWHSDGELEELSLPNLVLDPRHEVHGLVVEPPPRLLPHVKLDPPRLDRPTRTPSTRTDSLKRQAAIEGLLIAVRGRGGVDQAKVPGLPRR